MYKNIAISLLGAWVLRDVFGTTEVREQIAIVMGLAAMLFIFLLFCEDQLEKLQKKQKTLEIIQQNFTALLDAPEISSDLLPAKKEPVSVTRDK